MFNKGGKHRQDIEPEEKSENGVTTDQSSEQQKVVKGKRRRSHSESEVDTQKHKERKRRRTISESSVDSPDTEQHGGVKQKHKDLKRSEGTKVKYDEGRLGGEPEGKDSKVKKSVQWEEDGQTASVGKGKSGVTSMLGRKRLHDESMSNEEGVEQKRQRLSEDSDSRAKNSAAESSEDETGEGSKKQKKRKRKKKEKKETRLPHLRVISKLVQCTSLRYVLKSTLMRFMNCMIDITRCPLTLIRTKTHIILSNMKSYENDRKVCVI